MTFSATLLWARSLCRRHLFRHGLCLALAGAALFPWLSGCASGGAPRTGPADAPGRYLAEHGSFEREGPDFGLRDGEADGALELTAEPLVELELDGQGRASLASLEKLAQSALSLAAEGRLDAAQDHLFVLADQAELPPPAEADSLYLEQRASLLRRAGLLAAVLAEQYAFAGDPTAADSLLADGYARLGQLAFPDSLVPATGAHLPAITVDLLKVDNQAVTRWVNYFSGRGRDHVQIWLERRAEVDSMITAILDENGLPRELLYLAMIESGLSPRAVSYAKAVGYWQFMAPTGRGNGLRIDWWIDERRDLEASTRAACRYLRALYNQFGDWALVLAAYNTGEGRVERTINRHGHDDFWNLKLPQQTVDHIPKFIAAARIGEDPERYGFTVPAARPLQYDLLPVDAATDLKVVARCAGVEESVIEALNPALVRGLAAPDGKTYQVKVPRGTGPAAQVALAKLPADKRLTWSRHRVARGETLGRIAGRYGTSVAEIARANKLAKPYLIHPGDELLIPMPGQLSAQAAARLAEAAGGANAASGGKTAAKAAKKAKGGGRYEPPAGWERVTYKVRRGDTVGGG
ncbi:LysM peptidoglycan-binding domain-containing protein, partial [bacterium]|nr:LysM peptidoglycan-binding domain-containing protein [bacterium]